jgi:hypothetical protein
MTGEMFAVREVHLRFLRDDRDYCAFSLSENSHEFLYFSHRSRPLRSLFYEKDPGLCIECGLGIRILGSVSLDGPDCIAWNCSRWVANRILAGLRRCMGDEGTSSVPSDEEEIGKRING